MLRIRANTIISDEGDQDPSLYYVVSGKLVAEQQMEVLCEILQGAV